MGYGAPLVVEGQPRVALPYGLFSVVTLRDSSDPHWAGGGIEWTAMSCSPASAFIDPDCDTEMEKFFRDMNVTGDARPFTVYGSAQCGLPGGRADLHAEEAAQAMLLAREQEQAERAVWNFMAAEAADLNPSGAMTAKEGLAALEGWMGSVYGSLGAIHGSRWAVSLMSGNGLVTANGQRLLTNLGTPTVAGSGFPGTSPGGTDPGSGEQWVFASPALFGYRGSVFTSQAPDVRHNDYYALAERQYVVAYDPCGIAAVRISA